MSRLPDSLEVVLNELRHRLHRAARAKDIPEIERLANMIEGLEIELSENTKEGKE